MVEMKFFARRGAALAAGLFIVPAIFGCGGTDRLKKQVAGLETQVTAMRADQDRLEERLAAVELSSSVPRGSAAATPATEHVEHPRLKVIHLAPEDEESTVEEPTPSASPDNGGRRPIIRGTGDRVIKLGDADSNETTQNGDTGTRPVAQLGKDSSRN